jgi:hypothetical protein
MTVSASVIVRVSASSSASVYVDGSPSSAGVPGTIAGAR